MSEGQNHRVADSAPAGASSGTGLQPDGGTGFQPVDPWKSQALRVHVRNLPHVDAPGATFFATFRCQPGTVLKPAARDLVLSAIRYWDGKRIALDAAVVMPDHAHALFRIVDGSPLGKILHSIKSYSANQVNKLRDSESPQPAGRRLWLEESFDRIVRSEGEWREKIAYISQNPAAARLVEAAGGYPWMHMAPGLERHRQDACATGPG